jgi:hypothetical protein
MGWSMGESDVDFGAVAEIKEVGGLSLVELQCVHRKIPSLQMDSGHLLGRPSEREKNRRTQVLQYNTRATVPRGMKQRLFS